MASLFSKLFKPKWQHASPVIRREEIERLDAHLADNQEIFLNLSLNDSDNEVRLSAIQRINDPATLLKHFSSYSTDIQPRALERVVALCEQLGLSLFDMIEDQQLLAQIIINTDQPETMMNGLALIQNEDVLLQIARDAQLSKMRQAAAELIETQEVIQTLHDSAKSSDKSVFQITKNKLNAIKERQKLIEEQNHQAESLLKAVQEHRSTEDTSLYSAKLDSLVQRWKGLNLVSDQALQQAFDEHLEQCSKRAIELENTAKQEGTDSAQAVGEEPSNSEQIATLQTLTQTLDQLKQQAASPKDISAIDAIIKTQETRWIESAKGVDIEKSDQKQFQHQMGALRTYLSALQRFSNLQPTIEQSAESTSEDDLSQLSDYVSKIAWPDGFDKPSTLEQAQQRLSQHGHAKQASAEKQHALREQFETQLKHVDQALESKQIKESKAQLQSLRKTYGQLDKKHQNNLAAALKLRSNQLDELRDWLGFAASPQQEKLCEAMEALAEQHLEPQLKAEKIKSLQDQWKSLGGAQDQAIWDRFSTAADRAFEPCAAFFAEQSQLKKANLEKRATLLSELKSYVEQNNWEACDWKAVEKINRQARSEWRDAYPVDHKKSRPFQDQFNQVLNELDRHLNGEKDRNLRLKQEIVDSATALVNEEDLNKAMQSAKQLQANWQSVGITDHKKDRALWKAFRVACDAIFARRDAERNLAKEALNESIEQANQRLKASEELLKQDIQDSERADSLLASLRKEQKELGELPAKVKNRISERYSSLIESVKTKQKALAFASVQKKWNEARRKALIISETSADKSTADARDDEFKTRFSLGKRLEEQFQSQWISLRHGSIEISDDEYAAALCVRCEIAAGVESPKEDQDRRMQLQVSRLSEGLSGSANQSREEQLNSLLEEWYAGCAISTEHRKALEPRLEACIQKVFGVPHAEQPVQEELAI